MYTKVDSPAWKIHELLVVNLVRETLKLKQFEQKVSKFYTFFQLSNNSNIEFDPFLNFRLDSRAKFKIKIVIIYRM